MGVNIGIIPLAVGLVGGGGVITQAAVGTDPTSLIAQGAGVALALSSGFWLIRRYDARADAAQLRADQLLATERDAHQATRAELAACVKARAIAEADLEHALARIEELISQIGDLRRGPR